MFKKETLEEKEIRMREKEITIYYGENPWCSPPSKIGGGSVLKLVFHGGPIFFFLIQWDKYCRKWGRGVGGGGCRG